MSNGMQTIGTVVDWRGWGAVDYAAQLGVAESERAQFNANVEQMTRLLPLGREECADLLYKLGSAPVTEFHSQCKSAHPTDPRARALAAKRNTSHGPQQSASWRGRGRVTKYKEG